MYQVLVINPGSTSTKIALFRDENKSFQRTVDHSMEEINNFPDVLDQLEMREKCVAKILEEEKVDKSRLSAVMGRGGLLPHVKAGGYLVNRDMLDAYFEGKASPHAANLGGIIAYDLAKPLGIPAYIYDAVTSDEMDPIAKLTGLPEYKRQPRAHVLNQKAVARMVAAAKGKKYEEMRTIIAHLGGGITIGAHRNGRIVDSIGDDSGPFSPERSGSLPLLEVIRMCYKGEYNYMEMVRKIRGMGGIKAYLGTTDMRKVEEMIREGNRLAKEIYEAQAYQVAKGIGEMAPVLCCDLDCIVLTGGMAHSEQMTKMIAERVRKLAPVEIYPGEYEMEALNAGALRILRGEEKAKEYVLPGEERRREDDR